MTTPTSQAEYSKPIGLKIADGISTVLLTIIATIIGIADEIIGH